MVKGRSRKGSEYAFIWKENRITIRCSFSWTACQSALGPKMGYQEELGRKKCVLVWFQGSLHRWYIESIHFRSLFSSGNLNDGKAAIPLLKWVHERFLQLHLRYQTVDAGYDYEPIYEQVHRMGQQSVIASNKRNEGELIGFDKNTLPLLVFVDTVMIILMPNMIH